MELSSTFFLGFLRASYQALGRAETQQPGVAVGCAPAWWSQQGAGGGNRAGKSLAVGCTECPLPCPTDLLFIITQQRCPNPTTLSSLPAEPQNPLAAPPTRKKSGLPEGGEDTSGAPLGSPFPCAPQGAAPRCALRCFGAAGARPAGPFARDRAEPSSAPAPPVPPPPRSPFRAPAPALRAPGDGGSRGGGSPHGRRGAAPAAGQLGGALSPRPQRAPQGGGERDPRPRGVPQRGPAAFPARLRGGYGVRGTMMIDSQVSGALRSFRAFFFLPPFLGGLSPSEGGLG